MLVRLLGLAAVLAPRTQAALELGLVGVLVVVVLPVLRRAGPLRARVGLAVLGLLVFGAWRAPLETLVLFAVAHNLTPVGFLADALEGRARTGALFLAALLFGVVPLVIASGWPARLARRRPACPGSACRKRARSTRTCGSFVPSFWRTTPGRSTSSPPPSTSSASTTPW